jgi:hypothetical protein
MSCARDRWQPVAAEPLTGDVNVSDARLDTPDATVAPLEASASAAGRKTSASPGAISSIQVENLRLPLAVHSIGARQNGYEDGDRPSGERACSRMKPQFSQTTAAHQVTPTSCRSKVTHSGSFGASSVTADLTTLRSEDPQRGHSAATPRARMASSTSRPSICPL